MSCLHDAARNGDLVALTAAIVKGEDINAPDKHKRTPLMLAAWSNHANAIKLLLEAGALPHAVAADEMNALHFACQKGNVEAAR